MQNSNDDFSDSNINRNVWLSQTSAQSLPSRTINVPPSGLIDNTNGRNSNSVDKTLTQYHQNGVINEKNPMKINVKSRNDDDYDDEDNGDTISRLIGHYGLYQFGWTIFIILFQIPSAFHIFSFMFQVSSITFYLVFLFSFLWHRRRLNNIFFITVIMLVIIRYKFEYF